MNARRCAGGLEPALTLALIASLLSGCLRFNELGPDPLLDGLQSLLIKQADGGYQAISLCSSDRFLIDGDLEALGFKASLRELGLNHGRIFDASVEEAARDRAVGAARGLRWSKTQSQWRADSPFDVESVSLPAASFSVEPLNVDLGSFPTLERTLKATSLGGSVYTASTPQGGTKGSWWLTVEEDSQGMAVVRADSLPDVVLDVDFGSSGSAWLLAGAAASDVGELLVVRNGRVLAEELPTALGPESSLAQNSTGSRIAVVTTGEDPMVYVYEISPTGDLGLILSQNAPPDSQARGDVEVRTSLVGDGSGFIGAVRYRTVFRITAGAPKLVEADSPDWLDTSDEEPDDLYATHLFATGPGTWGVLSASRASFTVRYSNRGSVDSCSRIGLPSGEPRPQVLHGRLILGTNEGFYDPQNDCALVPHSLAGGVLHVGSALVLSSCDSGCATSQNALGASGFASPHNGCDNTQVTQSVYDR